jgi:galactose mutarotase-like enzyme
MKWEAIMQDQDGMETPINLCNHAYWNLSGDFSENTVENHTLQLEASRVLEFDKYQIPTGVI